MFVQNWLFIIPLLAGMHVIATWLTSIHRGNSTCYATPLPNTCSKQWPSVTVVVPAWCERGTLERCVASLSSVEYPNWEVIIVAGGPDGTYQAAIATCIKYDHMCVLEQQPFGKNAALNQGLSKARGEVIVLLDADSQVHPDWLRLLVAPINHTILATTGMPKSLRQTPIALGEQMEYIAAWGVHNVTTLQGSGSIAIHRAAIERIGGIPEDVLVGVDWDMSTRLAAHGVMCVTCPEATVLTERPATLREYWRNEVRWRRAHIRLLFRHAGHFLRTFRAAVSSLYIYALSWFVVVFTLLVIISLTNFYFTLTSVGLWIIFILWLLLRRAALAAKVAAFTGDLYWLRLSWVPPLLLCITIGAIVWATLTVGRTTRHFKGPRVQTYGKYTS